MSRKEKTKKGRGSGIDLKDRPNSKNKMVPPKKYKCIMLNDDFTPMDFVIVILIKIFHKNPLEAYSLMMDVHKKGRGIAGIYSKEIAETKCSACKKIAVESGYPFLVQIESE